MSTVWHRLHRALLKLVGRLPSANVVSGGRISSELQKATAWNGPSRTSLDHADVENQKRGSSIHKSPAAPNDHQLHGTRVQQSPEDDRQPTASVAKLSTHRASSELDSNSFPVQLQRQHRRASSAGSEISLSSVVSTTGATSGAYTGFTQHGQYDLTHDVILRGEFISDQQAKVTPDIQAACCTCHLYPGATHVCLAGSHCMYSSCYLHWRHNLGGCPQLQIQKGMVIFLANQELGWLLALTGVTAL